jgi:hypothetical protein
MRRGDGSGRDSIDAPGLSGDARATARSRHPSAHGRPAARAALAQRLAQRAAARGAAWPCVAAAVILLRGVAGDDAATFAARVGVPADVLDRLERGQLPPSEVPASLRGVAELIDWTWVAGGADGSARRGQGF